MSTMLKVLTKLVACRQACGHQLQRGRHFTNAGASVVENLSGKRCVLHLQGVDRYSFLQGLVTNDVEQLQGGANRECMYSLMLNHKGRFMHDLFLYKLSEESSLLIDLHKDSLKSVVKVLNRYKLRSKIDIKDVSDEYSVLYSSTDTLDDDAFPSRKHIFKDPRHASLGYRCLVEVAPSELPSNLLEDAPTYHTRLRYTLGIPEGDDEIPSGKAIPLEYNLDALNGISYTKGCYMGQELTARTHFQGLVRKRLTPVTISSAGADDETMRRMQNAEKVEVVDTTSRKKKIGQLVAAQGQQGLALLRLKGLEGKQLGLRLKSKSAGDGAHLDAHLPEWWRPEWYASAQE